MHKALRWLCDGCHAKLGDIRLGVLLVDGLKVAAGPESLAVTCPDCDAVRVWGRQSRGVFALDQPVATTVAI